MAKKSKWFEELLVGVREPLTWSNVEEYTGAGALHLLEGDERTEAEDILIERLGHDDGRAARALADLKSTRAIPELRARLGAGVPGVMRLAVARALHRLGDAGGLAAAIDVLAHGADDNERLAAVSLVGDLGGDDAERALEAALGDPDSTVRSAAAGMLIRLHGLQDFNRTYQDRLGLLQNRLASPLAAVRRDALAELHDIFARSARGETPAQLELTWRADDAHEPLRSFVTSLQSAAPPYQDDYALDVMAKLSGRERTWVEDSLWHFLPTDPRAARAAAHLEIQRAIDPLREVLSTATGAVAIEAAGALWRLAGDTAARDQLEAATRGADAALADRARAALAPR